MKSIQIRQNLFFIKRNSSGVLKKDIQQLGAILYLLGKIILASKM